MSKTPEQVAKAIRNQMSITKAPVKKYTQAEIQKDIQSSMEEGELDNKFLIVRDPLTWRERPIRETYTNALADELEKWLEQEPACLMLEEFLSVKKMTYDFFYMMCDRSPKLSNMHDYAMMTLGIRRERGGLTNSLNAGLVERSQHIYSRTWKKGMIEREAAKAQESEKGTNITVVMPDFGDDSRVPVRIKKDKD